MKSKHCGRIYSGLIDPFYTNLETFAKKHKNLARIGALPVTLLDSGAAIAALPLMLIESLVMVPVNLIGMFFSKKCTRRDAKLNLKNTAFLSFKIIELPISTLYTLAKNVQNPKNHRAILENKSLILTTYQYAIRALKL